MNVQNPESNKFRLKCESAMTNSTYELKLQKHQGYGYTLF